MISTTPFFDIVIVNFNSTDFLLSLLAELEPEVKSGAAAVYVEDNHSSDHSQRIAKRFPWVDLNLAAHNRGFAKAANQGMARGRAPWILLLNPDTSPQASFFGLARQFLASHPKVGLMGPRVLDPEGTLQASGRRAPTPLTGIFGRSSLISRWLPQNRITRGNLMSTSRQGEQTLEVDWLSGACLFARRQALQEVGGFDERFFMYWEDADLGVRMKRAGWQVVYYPDCQLVHWVGVSSEKALVRSTYYFHKSAYLYYVKHAGPLGIFLAPAVMLALGIRCLLLSASRVGRRLFWRLFGIRRPRPQPPGSKLRA